MAPIMQIKSGVLIASLFTYHFNNIQQVHDNPKLKKAFAKNLFEILLLQVHKEETTTPKAHRRKN